MSTPSSAGAPPPLRPAWVHGQRPDGFVAMHRDASKAFPLASEFNDDSDSDHPVTTTQTLFDQEEDSPLEIIELPAAALPLSDSHMMAPGVPLHETPLWNYTAAGPPPLSLFSFEVAGYFPSSTQTQPQHPALSSPSEFDLLDLADHCSTSITSNDDEEDDDHTASGAVNRLDG